jgi:hypothetical protein
MHQVSVSLISVIEPHLGAVELLILAMPSHFGHHGILDILLGESCL